MKHKLQIKLFFLLTIVLSLTELTSAQKNNLSLNDSSYFEKPGLNILVFSNFYGIFGDEKHSGVEIIQHGVRTATNGDVRLSPTPEQWDPIPQLEERKVDKEKNFIETYLTYPDYNFKYMIRTEANNDGIKISVNLSDPLPKELIGKAGLNLEFLPAAYFEKTFIADHKNGSFPLYPFSNMQVTQTGSIEPKPLASGMKFTLAPVDPLRRVSIESAIGKISLYDGRNKAQNGWFVLRTLLPAEKTGKVVEWLVSANAVPNWIRKPVITHSQLGYHPDQKKVAVIEFDKNDTPLNSARLLKAKDDGSFTEVYKGELQNRGNYLRYDYSSFDFSSVKEDGIYVIEYDTIRTSPFRISEDIYKNAWHPTLDIYLPVQMDHMMVNEAYRIWHGASHLDDALQAPINHEHFDLYAQGPTTGTPYKPGEHIPGLNVGGWYDAGDYDIRTQTQYAVVSNLVQIWEDFHLMRDETTINEKDRFVDIHHPDGKPDILQQIEHGTLQLLAQFKSVGHAINGIIAAHLSQYTHLGDGSTKTDNLIFNPQLDSLESDGFTSGTFDDRWAFTNKSSALNYGSIAALTAASRALRGYNDELANECFETAVRIWDEEHSHEPDLFRYGNTTGGQLESEELKAAVELLITTKENKYAERLMELLSDSGRRFIFNSTYFVRAIPYMDESYKEKIRTLVENSKQNFDRLSQLNPFGVLITTGGWAGDGIVVNVALTNYILHKAFPDLIDPESVYRGLNYIYGCHPGSDISFVSAVGTVSKKVAYGNNRADFSFIAGGVVPGELILKPDFPENKEDWPFMWGENEYVVNLASSYIYLVNAVNELLNEDQIE
ncbi:glycoside hydrolase family 9 protein [bacterium BMS3Abin03]|nr:glycoside hydrolase family 9 protein [bacterium BMS3Abin03]